MELLEKPLSFPIPSSYKQVPYVENKNIASLVRNETQSETQKSLRVRRGLTNIIRHKQPISEAAGRYMPHKILAVRCEVSLDDGGNVIVVASIHCRIPKYNQCWNHLSIQKLVFRSLQVEVARPQYSRSCIAHQKHNATS